jgi:predicted TIM-barrel fold metal-dependent hydrolase
MSESIIDTDIHPWIGGMANVFPYMDADAQRHFEARSHLSFMTALPGRAPKLTPSLFKPETFPPGGGTPGTDPVFLAQDHLDVHDIEAALLVVVEGGLLETWTDPDAAAIMARAINDYMADLWLPVDERYHLAMAVSPHDPQLAAEEIRRFGPTERVCAIWLPVIRRPLGDRYFFPIYEAAQELGLPLLFHPTGAEGDYIGSPDFAGGTPGLRIERFCMLAQIAWTNIVSMIFQGVFERYPGVKLICAEYGFDWVPALLWRMDNIWKAARPTAPWVKRAPSEYLRDHIRFTSQPAMQIPTNAYTEHTLEAMHAERTLLYSSDYPHWDGEETPERVFTTASPELRRRIFRDNALETFGHNLVLRKGALA